MKLKQTDITIQGFNEAKGFDHLMDSSNTPAIDGIESVGYFIVNVAGSEHGLFLLGPVTDTETMRDSLFAFSDDLLSTFTHSKCPPCVYVFVFDILHIRSGIRHFEHFYAFIIGKGISITLV